MVRMVTSRVKPLRRQKLSHPCLEMRATWRAPGGPRNRPAFPRRPVWHGRGTVPLVGKPPELVGPLVLNGQGRGKGPPGAPWALVDHDIAMQ